MELVIGSVRRTLGGLNPIQSVVAHDNYNIFNHLAKQELGRQFPLDQESPGSIPDASGGPRSNLGWSVGVRGGTAQRFPGGETGARVATPDQ